MEETINTLEPQEQKKDSLISISVLFANTFSFYKENMALIYGIAAIPFIVGVFETLAVGSASLFSIILIIASFVVSWLSRIALMYAVLEKGNTVDSAYKKSMNNFLPYFWVGGLSVLAALGGFFLLIIPGLIVSLLLLFSLYVFVGEKKKGTDALVASWYYTRGNLWKIIWRMVVFEIIFGILGFLVAMITGGTDVLIALKNGVSQPEVPMTSQIATMLFNQLIYIPMTVIYSYFIYDSLKGLKLEAINQEEDNKIKSKLKIFMAIGVAGLIIALFFSGFAVVNSILHFK